MGHNMELHYHEPTLIEAGKKIYEAKSTNLSTVLSTALITVRQLGPAGLKLWIERDNKNRKCILIGLQEADITPDSLLVTDVQVAWDFTEQIVSILCYAKWYAKSMGKSD